MKPIQGFADTQSLIIQRYKNFNKIGNVNLAKLFLKQANFLPIPDDFDMQELVKNFVEKLNENGKTNATVKDYGNQLIGILIPAKKWAGLIKTTKYFLIGKSDDFIFYVFKDSKSLFEKNSKTSKITSDFEQQIREQQQNYTLNNYKLTDNVLTKKLTDFQRLTILSICQKNELLLVALPIKNVIDADIAKKSGAKQFFYIMTDSDASVVGFNSKKNVAYYKKISIADIELKNGLFASHMQIDKFKMQADAGSQSHFKRIIDLNKATAEARLKEVISINYENSAMVTANTLMHLMKEKTGDNFYDFTRLFIDFISDKARFSDENQQDRLFAETKKVLASDIEEEKYEFILSRSGLTSNDKLLLMNLLLHSAESLDDYENGLAAGKYIYEAFTKEVKNKTNILIVTILYARFLLKADKADLADGLIKKIKKLLPDEELTLLMPYQDTDLLSPEGGKYLLSRLYELMMQTNTANREKYLHYLAEIEPLNLEYLKELVDKETKYSNSAKEICDILEGNSEGNSASELDFDKLKKISTKSIRKNLKHPAERKNGTMSYVNKWIKNNKKVDYSAIKPYMEILNEEAYPQLTQKLITMAKVMGLPKTQWYMAHGNMADRLVAYPGEPPFVIIGKEVLQQSDDIVTILVARQLAHLVHGHAKITANDSWLNLKKNYVIDIEDISKSIKLSGLKQDIMPQLNHINRLTDTIYKAINLSNDNADKAKSLNILYQFLNRQTATKPVKNDINNILIVKNLLTISADRTALLFAPNLQTAVKALIYQYKITPADSDINLREIIYMKNNHEKHKYPELVLRFLNMASFYLSDDYQHLSKKIKKNITEKNI